MVGYFHFLSGKALFGTTVDDDEPQNCDIKKKSRAMYGKSVRDAQFSIFHSLNYNFNS